MSILRTAILLLAALVSHAANAADDDNVVFVDQIGTDNSGAINQAGILNQVGREADTALQNGFYNSLEVNQNGEGNRIGTQGAGLNQNGQSATPTVFNRIVIDQQSNYNIVGEVQQSALGSIPDGANRLSVTQQAGDRNSVGAVIQSQSDGMPGQTATLVQTGQDNAIARVEQQSLTPANYGENSIRAEFNGDSNGRYSLSGFAQDSGALSSELVQTIGGNGLGANGNKIDLLVTGDANRFGVYQGGQLNTVHRITVQGSSNQIGIRQDGFQNDFINSAIYGDGNIVGFEQLGTNTAYLDMPGHYDVAGPGNDNQISAFQDGANDLRIVVAGSSNTAIVRQDYTLGVGGSNDAELNLIGSNNFVDLAQNGANQASISYTGARNNAAAFGAASLAETGLGAGTFSQTGFGNSILVAALGQDNITAVLQLGDNNAVTALVWGDANEAVVMQAGADNTAWLVQSGNGNQALISQ